MGNVPELSIDIDCCEHTNIAQGSLQAVKYDSKTQNYKLRASVVITNVALLKHALDSLGVLSIRFRAHGTSSFNFISSLASSIDLVVEVASSENATRGDAPAPLWIFPTNTSNSWQLMRTDPTHAVFKINFPLYWPAPFKLVFEKLQIEIKYKGVNTVFAQ